MKKLLLKEKLVLALGLVDCEQAERQRIIAELTQMAVEKTLEELLESMAPEEIQDLQQYITKDPNDLPDIYQKHQKSLENFLIIFNKNLNELIREFRAHAS
ncbi:MAG: hypothetical protein WC823_05490 [Parcubacteria group bacterium]|jgi:hypothetical protein